MTVVKKVLMLILVAAPLVVGAGLVDLARSERWDEVLRQAAVRQAQLPLTADEALVAARAAREMGDADAEDLFLTLAATDAGLSQVASVELAEAVVEDEPARAVKAVLPVFRRPASTQLRAAAIEVAERAVRVGLEAPARAELERARTRLSWRRRRSLDLALAETAPGGGRVAFNRLLKASVGDLEALAAARGLAATDMSAAESWLVAQTYYQHALYSDAEPLLEGLFDSGAGGNIPTWNVTYLRGRCAFRRGRWAEAITWYERAYGATRSKERRAGFKVHIGRCHELAGDLESAIEGARQAVILKASDDRRLFLARLRLRNEQPELAAKGVGQIRGVSARDRGRLIIALDELGRGEMEAAEQGFGRIKRRSWQVPAAVVLAGEQARLGRHADAVSTLKAVARHLDFFWGLQARAVMGQLPVEVRDAWRDDAEAALSTAGDRTRRRCLVEAAALELEPDGIERLRLVASTTGGLSVPALAPAFASVSAERLWNLGLDASAIRWFPSGMPYRDSSARLWTALQFAAVGEAKRSIQTADDARRMALPGVDYRALPEDLRRALYPLPKAEMVAAAASDAGIPWSLLAGVAREESRWDASVLSRVGARGLVQLMPSTAHAVAARLGRPALQPGDIFDPATNLHLGAAELARLLGVFDGWQAPVVASYNAGEAQAKLWLTQCGPGCDTARYVATITFSATRGYTANVLASASAYGDLYELEAAQKEPDPAPRATARNGLRPGDSWPLPANVQSRH